MIKKSGYTLAEIIIAIGVVAIIAAVMLPLANKMKPDKEKVMYLSVYDSIHQAFDVISSNPRVFPTEQNDMLFVNNPLFNDEAREGYPGGAAKICSVLADTFGAENNNCPANYIPNFAGFNGPSFVNKNGVEFYVTTNKTLNGATSGSIRTDIYFDVSGTEGQNCFSGEAGCRKPDRFKVVVGSKGQVVADDELGEYYLTHRANWKLKGEYELAGVGAFNDNDTLVTLQSKPEEVVDAPPQGGDEGGGDEGGGDDNPAPNNPPRATFKLWANGYVVNLRSTSVPGVYCELYDGLRFPDGKNVTDWGRQRHYIWNQDKEEFIELPGVYHTGSGMTSDPTYIAFKNGEFKGSTNCKITYRGKEFKIQNGLQTPKGFYDNNNHKLSDDEFNALFDD